MHEICWEEIYCLLDPQRTEAPSTRTGEFIKVPHVLTCSMLSEDTGMHPTHSNPAVPGSYSVAVHSSNMLASAAHQYAYRGKSTGIWLQKVQPHSLLTAHPI